MARNPKLMVIPDLLGGVSQLPPDQRMPNQVEVLDNGYCSARFGLRKRPPIESIARLSTSTAGWDTAFVHAVQRSDDERYLVCIVGGVLRVFDAKTGDELPVSFPKGTDYLQNNIRGFSAVTVGDHTFIVNKDRVVSRGIKKSPAPVHECLLFVRMVDTDVSFRVRIDGFVFEANTGGLGSTLSTEAVAKELYDKMRTRLRFFLQFEMELLGSTIYLKRRDGEDFDVEVRDGLGDKGLKLIKGSVQSLEDLPEKAKAGMVIEIAGEPGNPKDNFWVKFERTGPSGAGVWRETVAPGTPVELDASTMPHELVRMGTYMKPIVAHGLPRQPTYMGESGPGESFNFTKDGQERSINPSATHILTKDGSALRTDPLESLTNIRSIVTATFSVQAGMFGIPTDCTVVLSANTGSGWTEIARKTYYGTQPSVMKPDGTIKVDRLEAQGVFPAGTRFELKLLSPSAPIDEVGQTTLEQSYPILVVYGGNSQYPPIHVRPMPFLRFAVGDPGVVWPMGTTLKVTLDSSSFNYTLDDDQTTEQVAQGIVQVINAEGSYTASYSPPFSFQTPEGELVFTAVGFVVTKPGGEPPVNVDIFMELDDTKYVWDPNANMVPGEHVGRILRCPVTGAEGIIQANSVKSIRVASLGGGKRNTLSPGDRCVIVGAGETYFVFKPVDWEERRVGNEDLNPWPSFVGRRITEVFYHAGRLGFLSEDYVVLSATRDLNRLFRLTVREVQDDDPIDIQNAHKEVGNLLWAVPWEGRLVLCSSSGQQYSLVGEPFLSPATVRLEHLASYPVSSRCRPITLGTSMFIPRSAGGFATLRELYLTRDGIGSESCSEHVPRFVKGNATALAGDGELGFLAVLSDGEEGVLYAYHFGELSSEQRQKAWTRWTFGRGHIYAIALFDGYLYLVRNRLSDSGVWLERISLVDPPDPTEDHKDYGKVPYPFIVRLSCPFVYDRAGSPIISGRTQVNTVRPVVYGDLTVEVRPNHRPPKLYTIGPRRSRVPVLAENKAVTIDLYNDGPKGVAITGLEYEISYSNRSA